MVTTAMVSVSRAGPYVMCTALLRSLENSLHKLHKLIPVLGQKEGYSDVFSVRCDEIIARKMVVVMILAIWL